MHLATRGRDSPPGTGAGSVSRPQAEVIAMASPHDGALRTQARAWWGACLFALFALAGCNPAPAPVAPAGDADTAPAAIAAPPTRHVLTHGRFVQVPVWVPAGAMQRFVVWFTDGLSPQARTARRAALQADVTMLAEVEVAGLARALARDGGTCAFTAGDVENFARWAQAYLHQPTYRTAVVVGDGDGAALAYAVLAQAAAPTLAGAVSLDFCPRLPDALAMCASGRLKLAAHAEAGGTHRELLPGVPYAPWAFAVRADAQACSAAEARAFADAVPGARELGVAGGDALPAVVKAVHAFAARPDASVPPPPADLHGLPVVEVPVAAGTRGDAFAILASGDGGWASFDRKVAARLAQAGIPVVGLDSLRYFWSKRTPQGFAADLDRIARHYGARWSRTRVLMLGFSQGADVLPAAIDAMPPTTRERIALVALLSPGRHADYEFHVASWIGAGAGDGLPVAPAIARLPADRTLCVYGADDGDAVCPSLPAGVARVVKRPGDHHFGGDDAGVAALIVQAARQATPP